MLLTDTPIATGPSHSIDAVRLSSYIKDRIPGLAGDLQIFQFPAGHSNLTYMLKFGGTEFVLKCEPPGAKAKSAHDMSREFHVLSKLHSHYPFSPQPFLLCEDHSIIGGSFCLMQRLRGAIIRGGYPPEVNAQQIQTQFERLLEGLAALHSLDIERVELADFGRPQGYSLRQVEGWTKRLAAARTDNMPDFSFVTSWLTANIPTSTAHASVVHNDFKMDNLVWEATDITQLVGVLDWEMSTVGDPLMDLACTLSFWVDQDDPEEFKTLRAMPTANNGVFPRREAIAYYEGRTGRRVSQADFYLCFGMFRRAVIEQQKYFRFVTSQTQDKRFAHLDQAVTALHNMSVRAITGDIPS